MAIRREQIEVSIEIEVGELDSECQLKARGPVQLRAPRHVLAEADILAKAPNDGLPAHEFDNVVGMRLTAPLKSDENIDYEFLEKLAGADPAQAATGGKS